MSTDYQPRVITPAAEPGQVRRVGCLEIPANRAERVRPEPAPMIEGEVLTLERRPDGRMLCYCDTWPAKGSGCAMCRWQGSPACPSRFDDAYKPKTKPGPKPNATKPANRERNRASTWEKYREHYLIANMTPASAEALRARWRKKSRERWAKRKTERQPADNIPKNTNELTEDNPA